MPDDEKISRIILKNIEQIKWLGFFLLVRARRYLQIDTDSLLAVDQRPPILFLRSFDDDEKQRFTRSDKAFLDFSLETRLSNHFSRFGPFIAIGSPKEAVPQLGASRVLLSERLVSCSRIHLSKQNGHVKYSWLSNHHPLKQWVPYKQDYYCRQR
jgi:hypothetical protein